MFILNPPVWIFSVIAHYSCYDQEILCCIWILFNFTVPVSRIGPLKCTCETLILPLKFCFVILTFAKFLSNVTYCIAPFFA